MRKITRYSLATDENSPFEGVCMEFIMAGWQPFGGVALREGGGMCQAMVKYKEVGLDIEPERRPEISGADHMAEQGAQHVPTPINEDLKAHVDRCISEAWRGKIAGQPGDRPIIKELRANQRVGEMLERQENERKITAKIAGLESICEDLLIDVMAIANPKGIPILVDDKPLIAAFNTLMADVKSAYLSDELVLRPNPGAESNDD